MNELLKAWSDQWTSNQQMLMKAMTPSSATSEEGDEPSSPMEAQFKDLRDTWADSIEKWTALAKDGGTATLDPNALRELFSPAKWSGPGAGSFDAGLRRVLDGPQYAMLWDLDRKLLELQRLAIARDKEVAAHQAVVQKAWSKALERFTGSVSMASKRPKTWRELTDRWLETANETLIEVHRSNEFIEAQQRMLRAASEYRLQERKLAETWCDACHIPTRTEMDEMQRTVTELRRQVRLLKRQAQHPAAPGTQTAATRKRSAASANLSTARSAQA